MRKISVRLIGRAEITTEDIVTTRESPFDGYWYSYVVSVLVVLIVMLATKCRKA